MEKFYKYFSKVNQFLLKLEVFCGCILLGTLFVIMITNATLRYLFQSGLNWSDELNGFIFVWFSFISACYIMGVDKHLSVTAFSNLLPRFIRYIIKQIMNTIMIFFSVFYVISLNEMMVKLPISNVMRIPMPYVYIIIPLCFSLFVIHILHNIMKDTYLYCSNKKEG